MILDPGRRRALRQRSIRGVAVIAVSAGPAALLAWVVLGSGWLAVDRVEVSGSRWLTDDQVRTAAQVPLGRPMARLDTAQTTSRLRALPSVRDVRVQRRWPSTVRLTISERNATAAVRTGPDFTVLSPEGIAIARSRELPEGALRLEVARPGPDDAVTRAALAVVEEVPEPLRDDVDVVQATSPVTVTLVLRDGRRVVWGQPGRAGHKSVAAQALLALPGSVVDVSAPGVVIRRP